MKLRGHGRNLVPFEPEPSMEDAGEGYEYVGLGSREGWEEVSGETLRCLEVVSKKDQSAVPHQMFLDLRSENYFELCYMQRTW